MAIPMSVRIGTRGSPLALWQARRVRDLLVARSPGLDAEIVTIRTSGEKFPDQDFRSIGVGIFTREIDTALVDGRVEIAVHSLKDLPTESPRGLTLAAVPERESPLDAWVSPAGIALENLPRRARVGTSSPRRQAQLLARRDDLDIVALRGNVQTRLRKIAEENLHGTVLAEAGLRRLGYEKHIQSVIPTEWIVPAVSQGALGVVAREDQPEILELLRAIDDPESRTRIRAERAFLSRLRGGCQVPAGALATLSDDDRTLHLEAVIASLDGRDVVRGEGEGPAAEAAAIGEGLAQRLLEKGGSSILGAIRH